jgi:hypothetical protein
MFSALRIPQEIFLVLISVSGPGSSVCIATGYRLDGPGIESMETLQKKAMYSFGR